MSAKELSSCNVKGPTEHVWKLWRSNYDYRSKPTANYLTTNSAFQHLLCALKDFKENVLPKDPALFASMAEAPLEDLDRLRQEVEGFLDQLQPVV